MRKKSKQARNVKPWWLGAAIIARHDPNLGYTIDNIYWRSALSAEEAETEREIYVGAALRERLLEVERQGWAKVDRAALAKIKDLKREASPPRYKIETGYKNGGGTWISDRWNAGELTREQIHDAIANYRYDETEDEIRAELRESEADVARELFEEEGNTTSYDELLNDRVECELERIQNEQSGACEVAEALQDLYDNWTDDADDYDHFGRVYRAHNALDAHWRKVTNGEYDW
jgi:hypothetical protein